MTATDIQKKNAEAESLKVYQVSDDVFHVESSEGEICYKVRQNGKLTCPCRDYTIHVGRDPEYRCKHILAVLNSEAERLTSSQIQSDSRVKLEKKYIINLHGKDFVLYAGLLDLAHQKGLLKLEVEPIQYPTKDNGMEAIVKAVAVSRSGAVYCDLGDSNPSNTNKAISQHVLRMASTRAKARVLRDFTNVGMTAVEELGSLDEALDGSGSGNGNGNNNTVSEKNRKTTSRTTTQAAKPERSETTPADSRLAETSQTETSQQQKPSTAVQTTSNQPAARQTQYTQSYSQPANRQNNQTATRQSNPQSARPAMSEAQKRAVYSLAKRRGISEESLASMCRDNFGVSKVEELSSTDAAAFIRNLQTAA